MTWGWPAKALGILLIAGAFAVGQEPAPAPPIGAAKPKYGAAEQLPSPPPQTQVYPISLPTALRLAQAQNPQIQFAQERIVAAEAELARADVALLPNLSGGGEWLRHDGQIQRTEGQVITISKSAFFAGGGFRTSVALADAYFDPLAARQILANRIAGARTAANDILRDVAVSYYETIRSKAAEAIARETYENAEKLDKFAQSYLRAQKLNEADAERARAEYRTRLQELESVRQATLVTSIRLAQLLRLDPFVLLDPAETKALPIILIDPNAPPNELAVTALMNRPELDENKALVNFAIEQLRRATYGPMIPSVLLDYRAGVFGGEVNGFVGNANGRGDVAAGLVWELKGLGFADLALKRQRESEVRQAKLQVVAAMDLVVAQVADSFSRLRFLKLQMDAARLAVASAERSYQLNWKLFTDGGLGLIRPIEVIQSINALASARAAYLNAIIDFNREQFQLYWALGNPVEHAQPAEVR
jgi:outer membrane protein TolC